MFRKKEASNDQSSLPAIMAKDERQEVRPEGTFHQRFSDELMYLLVSGNIESGYVMILGDLFNLTNL